MRICRPLAAGFGHSPVTPVYATGRQVAAFISTDPFHLILVVEAVTLISLAAWATWKVTGRVLRPVEAVRTELAGIDFGNLRAHLSEPAGAREIARLCRAINDVLQRLNGAKEELQQFARAQRQFAADLSHELRGPVAALRVQLEEARQDLGRVKLPEFITSMFCQVERLQAITDDMLFLARVGAYPVAERQQVNLAALVRTEIAQRSDRIPVRLRLTPDSTVNAVPTQISRLLANLLDNAQRHCKNQVWVDVRATPNAVELAVSDDGPGIALADRERVFHRLTRLDEARRLDRNGTGLGLAIARDIAHANHGTLRVEEDETGGARFVFRLPRVLSDEQGAT
ncbi:sensor histidine kinase [Microbispora sp. NPDC049125]|uniref:sensor histidine kinase n=1 Tax=Microbispora sp. NPDC049125 TaxID=3154929 RepID=UPI00346572C8